MDGQFCDWLQDRSTASDWSECTKNSTTQSGYNWIRKRPNKRRKGNSSGILVLVTNKFYVKDKLLHDPPPPSEGKRTENVTNLAKQH